MKLKFILAMLIVVLLIGCAKPQVAPEPVAPAPEPVQPVAVEPTPVEPVQEVVKPAPVEGVSLDGVDVALSMAGFDPEEVTVKKGTSIIVKVVDSRRHAVTSKTNALFTSKQLTKEDTTEIPLDMVGEFVFLDVTFGKRLTVTVTE